MPTDLVHSIISTVAYFDLFDYPLTYPELYRYLWRSPKTTLAEVIQTAKQLDQLVELDGFVMFKNRSTLATIRKQRYIESELKFNKRRWYIWLLTLLPGVEAILLVNTFSYHNVRTESDIDLLIVSRPHTIWATRFYTTVVAKLLRVRPRPNKSQDALCLSFYATPQGLPKLTDLQSHPNDAMEAYWIAQAMPVYDPRHYVQQIVNSKWLNTVLPNNQPITQHINRCIKHTWLHTIMHALGRLLLWNGVLKIVQLWIMPKQLKQLSGPLETSSVVLTDDLLKFHTRDPRPELLASWHNKIQVYSR
ncbi:MAG: hypothetical protein HY565_05920 [Candidatus Kerfeldbacteria bacterium]|nr:hypothetical protein [Candidatus Kerfeldbacteria bacterium]